MNKIIYSILIFLSLFFQTEAQNIKKVSFDKSQFKTSELNIQEGVRIELKNLGMIKAHLIKSLGDGVVAIADVLSDNLLVLLDINTGRNVKVIKRGFSSSQMQSIDNLWMNSDTLFFAGAQDMKIGFCLIDKEKMTITAKKIKRMDVQFVRAISLNKDEYIYLPQTAGCRLLKKNYANGQIRNMADFPINYMMEGYVPDNFIFQANMQISPNRKQLVVANIMWNRIELFDADLSQVIKMTGPEKIDSEVTKHYYGNSYMYQQSNAVRTFLGLSCSDDQFMVGYLGLSLSDESNFNRGLSRIYSFDLNGNSQNEYLLGQEAENFDVDFKTMELFTITSQLEPCIVKYSLNK